MNRIHKSFLLVWAVVPVTLACRADPPAPPEVPALAQVKSFSASPTQLNEGEPTTLTWEVENATSVTIRTLSGEPVAVPDGSSATGSVAVTVQAPGPTGPKMESVTPPVHMNVNGSGPLNGATASRASDCP